MLHGVSSKKSEIGKQKQHVSGRLKKAVSANQDDSSRQSHKGRLRTKYSKAITVLLSLKLKNYKGIPLLGGQGEYPPHGVDKTPLRGGADGKNN